MFKLVYCLNRKSEVSAEEFHRYWLAEHGPKVRARKTALRAVKYVQSHTSFPELNTLLQQSRGLLSPYDGITEVWWDSVKDLEQALATAEGAQAMQDLLDDESRFIDFTTSRLFAAEEHPIF